MAATISAVAAFLEQKLNAGSVDDYFKVFYWSQNLDARTEQLYSNDLPTEKRTFIPCVVSDIEGSYRPLSWTKVSDNTVILEIIFPLQNKANVELAFDNLASALVGQVAVIGGERCIFAVEKPTLSQVDNMRIEELNRYDARMQLKKTEFYGVLNVRIFFTAYTEGVSGNEVNFYFKTGNSGWTRFAYYSASQSVARTSLDEQYITQGQATTFNTLNGVGLQISFFLARTIASEPWRTLLEDCTTGGDQHRVYKIKREIGAAVSEQDMVLANAVVDYKQGGLIQITATFKKAWEGLING